MNLGELKAKLATFSADFEECEVVIVAEGFKNEEITFSVHDVEADVTESEIWVVAGDILT